MWLGLAVPLAGCEQLTRIEGDAGACIPTAVQQAFDRSCAVSNCHDSFSAGGLDLRAGASASILTRDAVGKPLPLVTIGDLDQSYLAHKLMAMPPAPIVNSRMPIGYDPTNPEQADDVSTILGWIAGAELAGCEASEGESEGATGAEPTAHGLPCEVDELLEQHCRSCHADPPVGAPMPLVNRDDLLVMLGDVTAAERASIRMANDASPMPPAPGSRVGADALAAFDAWIAAGMPEGSCEGVGGPSPFEVDPVCTSGVVWTDLDDGDPLMNPGRDCVSCHDAERLLDPDDDGIPDLLVGGTLYPTGHEPDGCYGAASPDLRVVLQSTEGIEVVLTPNGSGNFLLHRASAPAGFQPPFAVKVVQGDRERIMPVEAPHGSCNTCHTQSGTEGAPGRVVVP